MNKRVNLQEVSPRALRAMRALEAYLAQTEVSPIHKELIRIRVSQINGCSFCLDLHVREALSIGESQERIDHLSVWQKSALFTTEEKLMLKLTEEITLIHQHKDSGKTGADAAAFFSEEYLAELIMTIVTINAWNRIAITTELR